MTVQECYEAMGADYDDVISRLRTDERVTKFLLKILNDGSFQLLTDSLAAKNMEDAFRAAHTLKGVAMNLSLTALYHAAGPMTEALRGRSEYGAELEPLYTAVKQEYERTMTCIRALQ